MCNDEETAERHYFAISRNNTQLREKLEAVFRNSSEIFTWEDGEFCAILFEPSLNLLIFGRDVFGRKSLCWRITETDPNDVNCGFELSVLPGHGEGWQEVPPGCLFTIALPKGKVVLEENNKLAGKFRHKQIFDFRCKMNCRREEFMAQRITIQSHYPMVHFEANPLFKAFNSIEFCSNNSDILLKSDPAHQLSIAPNKEEIEHFTQHFIQRFFSAVEHIVQSVVFIGRAAEECANLEVPVLFSGGVDSLMVALALGDVLFKLASANGKKFTGKIRLISVAFGENEKDCSDASDRTQSIIAFEHLRQRSCEKYDSNPYSLVLVNVPKHELIGCRKLFIAEAIAPSKTVLDDSLGCVLWFATRMYGIEYETSESIDCKSPFAFVGSGSDEQLGGYARHRTCFETRGMDGLEAELSMEMHRIGERNFGRDDRVGMSNGRAILAPFLEEPLVRWLNRVPTAIKTGFSLPQELVGNGNINNKFLLRNALRQLQMPEPVVMRPKRAMQFGTRIAKLERTSGAQKGSDICERLLIGTEQTRTIVLESCD